MMFSTCESHHIWKWEKNFEDFHWIFLIEKINNLLHHIHQLIEWKSHFKHEFINQLRVLIVIEQSTIIFQRFLINENEFSLLNNFHKLNFSRLLTALLNGST